MKNIRNKIRSSINNYYETAMYAFRVNNFVTASMVLFLNGGIAAALLMPYIFKEQGLILSASVIAAITLINKVASVLAGFMDCITFKQIAILFVALEVISGIPILLVYSTEAYIYVKIILIAISCIIMPNFDLLYDKQVMITIGNIDDYTLLQRSERTWFSLNGLVTSLIGVLVYKLMDANIIDMYSVLVVASVLNVITAIYSMWWLYKFVLINAPIQLEFDFVK